MLLGASSREENSDPPKIIAGICRLEYQSMVWHSSSPDDVMAVGDRNLVCGKLRALQL